MPHRNFQQVAHERNEVAVALHPDLQHRVAVLGVLVGDALHDAAQVCRRSDVHKADDTKYLVKLRKKSRNSNAAGYTAPPIRCREDIPQAHKIIRRQTRTGCLRIILD